MKYSLLILLVGAAVVCQAQTTLPVKPGNRSVENALKKASYLEGDVVLELSGGVYRTDRTIAVSKGKWSSLTIKNKKGAKVFVTGDRVIARNQAKRVSDPTVLSRIQEEYRDKVLEIDCKKLGIHVAPIRPSGFGRKSLPAWSELIIDGKLTNLSRWPNDSTVLIGEVLVAGDDKDKVAGKLPVFKYKENRPKAWKEVQDLWISGYFGWGYADDMIPVQRIDTAKATIYAGMFTTYHFMTGTDFRRWYALNLIEEIDQEYDYVIDSRHGKLYFLPPGGGFSTLRLTSLESPLIAVESCNDVTIEDITFENSRGIGVYMDNTENVLIKGCTIRNVGNVGVCIGKGTNSPDNATVKPHSMEAGGKLTGRIIGDMMGKIYENTILNREAGRNNGIKDCYIYNTGAGGVNISGGDRVTLTRGDNFVENSKISNYNRIEKSYRPGVWMDGVGNRVTKCDIFNAPSMAILFHGNEHVVELCKITDVCKEVDDQGAIYYGRDPSEQGNIIRYNYFYRLSPRHRVTATYHDDGACGSEVYGNIYHQAGSLPVLIGGGKDHNYYNNIFMESPTAIHLDNRMQNWGTGMVAKGGIVDVRLEAVNFTKPPYSVAYPKLVNYWTEDPSQPQRNTIHGNLFYKINNFVHGNTSWGEFWNNWITNENPGFVDPQNPLKGFKEGAEIFKRIEGFKEIPYSKIGSTLQ